MGIGCCFRIRDHPSEIPHGIVPQNRWNSEIQSLLNKVKYMFHGNEVHHTHPTQPGIGSETSNLISLHDTLQNVERKPPGVVVIPDKTAASINVEVTAETQNTRARHEHTNAESGHHQSSEQNPDVELIMDKAGTSTDEGVPALMLSTSSCHEHPIAEGGQSSEQNHRVDATLDIAAASINAEVPETSNKSSCHVHLNVESGHSSEQNPETVTNINESTRTLSQDEVLSTQTEVNSSTLENPWTIQVDRIFFHQVFPSPDEVDECPTCLEDYNSDNPKIVAECSHHFHLSCIYDWLERRDKCPICDRLLVISGITE